MERGIAACFDPGHGITPDHESISLVPHQMMASPRCGPDRIAGRNAFVTPGTVYLDPDSLPVGCYWVAMALSSCVDREARSCHSLAVSTCPGGSMTNTGNAIYETPEK
jgi:hypothetical protein